MAVTVKLPTQLRDAAGGATSTSVEAGTVGEALEALYAEHGELRGRLSDDGGGLRRFVNVYIGGEDIRFLDGLDTPGLRRRRADDPARGRGRLADAAFAGRRREVVRPEEVPLERRHEHGGERLHALGHRALVLGRRSARGRRPRCGRAPPSPRACRAPAARSCSRCSAARPGRTRRPAPRSACGCRYGESQLGHAVSLATAANVPAAPDGIGPSGLAAHGDRHASSPRGGCRRSCSARSSSACA